MHLSSLMRMGIQPRPVLCSSLVRVRFCVSMYACYRGVICMCVHVMQHSTSCTCAYMHVLCMHVHVWWCDTHVHACIWIHVYVYACICTMMWHARVMMWRSANSQHRHDGRPTYALHRDHGPSIRDHLEVILMFAKKKRIQKDEQWRYGVTWLWYRWIDRECVPLLWDVCSDYRMCSLTIECVLLL